MQTDLSTDLLCYCDEQPFGDLNKMIDFLQMITILYLILNLFCLQRDDYLHHKLFQNSHIPTPSSSKIIN